MSSTPSVSREALAEECKRLVSEAMDFVAALHLHMMPSRLVQAEKAAHAAIDRLAAAADTAPPPDRNMEGAAEFIHAILMGQPIWPNPWGQDVAAAAFFLTGGGKQSTALYAAALPPVDERMEALRRLWPLFERSTKDLVFTADRAGEVAADMATLRAALAAPPPTDLGSFERSASDTSLAPASKSGSLPAERLDAIEAETLRRIEFWAPITPDGIQPPINAEECLALVRMVRGIKPA
jgi:hypothetical protein